MNGDDPAFPVDLEEHGICPGVTIRAYLAGQALIGFIAMHSSDSSPVPEPFKAAYESVRYADALIAELNKSQTETKT